jgi:hypothetical protein
VNVDHPGTRPDGSFDRLRHLIRDVVELQIEEDSRAEIHDAPDDRRSFEGKEPAADLEAARNIAQTLCQLQRTIAAVHVERDQEFLAPVAI